MRTDRIAETARERELIAELQEANRQCEQMRRDRDLLAAELQASSLECRSLRAELTAMREKCEAADIELEMSRRTITKLSDEVRRSERIVESFRNGAKFENLRLMYEHDMQKLRSEICSLRKERSQAERALKTMRKNWGDVFDDMLLEMDRERAEYETKVKYHVSKEEKAKNTEKNLRERLRNVTAKKKRAEDRVSELEDEKARLERKVNMNATNSGMTTAQSELSPKKQIANSREPSDKKRGGQPGHPGHRRKRLQPDSEVYLAVPDEIRRSHHWMKTGRKNRRQVIGLCVQVYATDYVSEEYQNIHTGKLYSPSFPESVVNEVNYADDLRAVLLYLTHYCNVSNDKARQFLHDVSGGALQVSHGFVDGLVGRFAGKAQERCQNIYDALSGKHAVHADFTVGYLNGKRVAIGICSDGTENVLYAMSHSKGHAAAQLLPISGVDVLISDRESTLVNGYSLYHQVCIEHLRRDLNDIIQNDPDREWPQLMKTLLLELWDKSKEWHKLRGLPKKERRAYEQRYDEILDLAEQEYEKKPASKALPEGPNLLAALRKLKQHVLYFVRHPWITPCNSEAERCARVFKRKQHQAVTFRSDKGIAAACTFLTVVMTARRQNKNVFDELLAIISEVPPPSATETTV